MWEVEVRACTDFHLPNQLMSLAPAFNPFTFKVIIDMYDPITIFLVVRKVRHWGGGASVGSRVQRRGRLAWRQVWVKTSEIS